MAIRYVDEEPAKPKIRYLDAAPEKQEASTTDKVIGSRPGRFALGASSLISGPLQLGANIGTLVNKYGVAPIAEAVGAEGVARRARTYGSTVADAINEQLQNQQQAKQRGMEAHGTEGFDAMGLAGAVIPAVAGGAPVKVAETLAGKVGQGAALGGFFGAASPVTNGGEDFWSDKSIQTAVGGAIGGAVPLATALAQKIGRTGRDIYDVLRGSDSSIERLKRAYYERLVGKQNVPSVAASLRNADPLIPGGKPTAAEAVSGNPFASPIQAQQQVTAGTHGGPSGEFGARAANQVIARGSAELERDAVTAPMRASALSAATNIDKNAFGNQLVSILGAPQTQAVTPARTFLSKIANDAYKAADDAESLYGVRKYIDDLINKRIDSPENVAGYASTQLIAMKKAIDEAIENGGAGGAWKAYLSEYAKRSRLIDKSTERAAEMYAPLQRTTVPGAANVSEQSATHLPNLLSRSAMIANYFARMARSNVEPKIDASMARDFLNPQLLAAVMEQSTPAAQSALSKALQKYGQTATTLTAVKAATGAN